MSEVMQKSVGAHPEDFKSELNAAAVIRLETAPGGHLHARWKLPGGICWSYNGVPTGGRLTIFGGGFHFDIDITADGPGFIPFPTPLHATDGTPIVVTLAAGGAGITGKLNILGKSTE